MAETSKPDTCVIVDDELYNMNWLVDFLSAQGFEILEAETANEAADIVKREVYRLLVIDLNIPLFSPLDQSIPGDQKLYREYPGLLVAWLARNAGYRDRQTVIYSVHREPIISDEASKLGCTYLYKGKPRDLKRELEAVISYDPTQSNP